MQDKILGLVSLGLSAASQVFIQHDQTASFFTVVFFAIGAYEFVLGEVKQRKSSSG
jgi:hypothetical protein